MDLTCGFWTENLLKRSNIKTLSVRGHLQRNRSTAKPFTRIHRLIRSSATGTKESTQDGSVDGLPLPPGSTGCPFIGETVSFFKDYTGFYNERYEQHGNVWKSNILGMPFAAISGGEPVRRILMGEFKQTVTAWPDSFVKLLGASSILNFGQKKHGAARRMLGQAFTDAAIKSYVPGMVETIQGTLGLWEATGDYVLGFTAARALAFDVAATALLGVKFDPVETTEFRDFFDVFLTGMMKPTIDLPFTPFGKAMNARREINAKLAGLIEKARAEAASGAVTGRANALQLLAAARDEDGSELSMEELQDQAVTQLFAGHETAGSTMGHLMQDTFNHPKVLARLRQEQADIIAKHGPEITGRVIEEMPYADAVIKESMRMCPIVDGVWRKTLEPIQVDGMQIPKDWTVQLMVGRTTRQLVEEFGEDVDQYNPDRWFEEPGGQGALRKEPKSYMPFGEGQRKCLGMPLAKAEMRIFLAVLAREFDFDLKNPLAEWKAFENIRPADYLPVKLSKLSRKE